MAEELEPQSGLLSQIIRGIVIAVAFVAVSALFAMLLRPLAKPHPNRDTIAIRHAPEGAAPTSLATPSAAAGTVQAPLPPPSRIAPLPAGPKVAILVTELGADADVGAAAIAKLPPAFALAFLPGEAATRLLARKAQAEGHEIWIGLPMQPKGWPRVTPGPNTLLVADPPAANAKRVEWALAQVDRPAGAYTMMGSAFTSDKAAMAPVAAVIRQHGLVLLDARSIGATVAASTVKAEGGRALSNDLFIDGDLRPQAINAALDRLVRQARSRGQAIGIARALPATLKILPAWADSLPAKGVALVPPARLAP